jgi:hypothetical protein
MVGGLTVADIPCEDVRLGAMSLARLRHMFKLRLTAA